MQHALEQAEFQQAPCRKFARKHGDRPTLTYRFTEAAKRDLIHVFLEGLEKFGLRQAEFTALSWNMRLKS